MNQPLKSNSPWVHIDAVSVVNLDIRPERWDAFIKSAEGLIPTEKIYRLSASLGVGLPGFGLPPWFRGRITDKRWGAKAGCTLSHQRTMETAVAHGWETILVMEDDADLHKFTTEDLTVTLEYLFSNPSSWDVCYLGYSKTRGPSLKAGMAGSREFVYVSGCATTHAYLVNRKARDWILKKLPSQESIWDWTARHRIIDRWYCWHLSRSLKVVAISPGLVPQLEGFSDIVEQKVDYLFEFPNRVTDAHTKALTYTFARMAWRIKGLATAIHDGIRYWIKRTKGF